MYINMPYSAYGCSFSNVGQAQAIYTLATKGFFNNIPIVNSVTYTVNSTTYTTTIEFKSCPNIGLRYTGYGSSDSYMSINIVHIPTNTTMYSDYVNYSGANYTSQYFVCAWDATTFFFIPNTSNSTKPAKLIFDYKVNGKDTLTSCHELDVYSRLRNYHSDGTSSASLITLPYIPTGDKFPPELRGAIIRPTIFHNTVGYTLSPRQYYIGGFSRGAVVEQGKILIDLGSGIFYNISETQ